MDETIKIWLANMYTNEIAEAKADIIQERTFLDGSTKQTDIAMHESNIEELEEYIDVLKELIAYL